MKKKKKKTKNYYFSVIFCNRYMSFSLFIMIDVVCVCCVGVCFLYEKKRTREKKNYVSINNAPCAKNVNQFLNFKKNSTIFFVFFVLFYLSHS